MKKIYIPAGETVTYNSLHTGRVVVYGTLHVCGRLTAKEIIGGGNVEAGEIICDDMRVSSATADYVTAKRIVADKLFVRYECRASGQIAVRDYLTAGYVCTGTLSVSLSDVGSCDADKVIMVRQRVSLLGLLWASWWRGLFLGLFHGDKSEKPASEGADTQVPMREDMAATPLPVRMNAKGETPDDDTIGLMIAVLSDLKERGYRVSKIDTAGESKVEA